MSFRLCNAETSEWWEIQLPINHTLDQLFTALREVAEQTDLDLLHSVVASHGDDITAGYTVIFHG